MNRGCILIFREQLTQRPNIFYRTNGQRNFDTAKDRPGRVENMEGLRHVLEVKECLVLEAKVLLFEVDVKRCYEYDHRFGLSTILERLQPSLWGLILQQGWMGHWIIHSHLFLPLPTLLPLWMVQMDV